MAREHWAIVYNPTSGQVRAAGLQRILEALAGAGVEGEPVPTQRAGHATELGRTIAGVDRIACYSGDGTLNELANGAIGRGVPIVFLPGGTANVMARELGLPRDPARAALAALAGTIRAVHPGTVNGRHFLLMAGMGFDAEAVWRVSLQLKRVLGKAAYGWAGLQALLAPPARQPGLRIGGQGPAWRWVVAARAAHYAGPYRIHPGAALQAAELGVVGVAPGAVLPLLVRLALGRSPGGAGVRLEQRPALRVEADAPAHLQVDGDYCLSAREFEIGIAAQSLPLCFASPPRTPGAAL